MNSTYRQRIALRFTLVTAILVLVVFTAIYLVVQYTVTSTIDRELQLETDKHVGQIFLVDGEIKFVHKGEWQEQEHSQIQLNPIFIEIVDLEGNSMDRSPNLGINHLSYFPDRGNSPEAWTHKIGSREVRQRQILLTNAGKEEGFLLVAKSFEDSRTLLTNLSNILLVLYPVILISLFLLMRYLAGKSIEPIQRIIEKTNQITQKNLSERVPAAGPEDEIRDLSQSINELLSRLEQALYREKQFTSEASHELRTPLAILRGTLEVLIRKPRTSSEYEEKIRTALQSIDRMSEMIEQLLYLARAGQFSKSDSTKIDLLQFGQKMAEEASSEYNRKVNFESYLKKPIIVTVNEKSLYMIINNLFQNAFKYSSESTEVVVQAGIHEGKAFLSIEDHGIGMEEDTINQIFDPFFRDTLVKERVIPGTGLGLAIVKKLAMESGIEVEVQSEKGKGSLFRLIFNDKS